MTYPPPPWGFPAEPEPKPEPEPMFTPEEVVKIKKLAAATVMTVAPTPEEAFTIRPALTRGVQRIAAERARQVMGEGYSTSNDAFISSQNPDMLARAAACYALPGNLRKLVYQLHGGFFELWPWPQPAFKPTPSDRIRELEKAGALIAAEIDRLLYNQDLRSEGDRASDDL